MIVLKSKSFSSRKEKSKDAAQTATGLGLGAAGLKLIKDSNREGELTGRVELYHSLDKKNWKRVRNKGLRNYHIKPGEKTNRNRVYLSKTKDVAESTGNQRIADNAKSRSRIVKVSIPYDEYKNKRVLVNPEFKNAKSYKDYLSKTKDSEGVKSKKAYDSLSGNKNSKTVILEGEISADRIKGSGKYKKNSLSQITKYIKNNSKHFGKGVAKVGAGTALVGLGIKTLKSRDKNKSSKDTDIVPAVVIGTVYGKHSYNKGKSLLNIKKEKAGFLKEHSNGIYDSEIKKRLFDPNSEDQLFKHPTNKHGEIIDKVKKEVKRSHTEVPRFQKRVDRVIAKSGKNLKTKSITKGVVVGGSTLAGLKLIKKGGNNEA